MTGLPWRGTDYGLLLAVRVTPRGGRDAIDGVAVGSNGMAVLRVRVAAPPDGGAANEAVRRLLGRTLGRPPSAVTIVSGAAGRTKTVRLAGDAALLERALAPFAMKEMLS